MIEGELVHSDNTKIELDSTSEKDKVLVKKVRPPGYDLATTGAIWIWGIVISYFPTYASIPTEWAWPFKVLSYICFGLGIVGSLFGLSNLRKSEFLEYVATGVTFGFVGYLVHLWASSLQVFWQALILRLIILVLAFPTLLFFLWSMTYLFVKPSQKASTTTETIATEPGTTPITRGRFEQIVAIIIATLSFLTALIPLIKTWLNVQ